MNSGRVRRQGPADPPGVSSSGLVSSSASSTQTSTSDEGRSSSASLSSASVSSESSLSTRSVVSSSSTAAVSSTSSTSTTASSTASSTTPSSSTTTTSSSTTSTSESSTVFSSTTHIVTNGSMVQTVIVTATLPSSGGGKSDTGKIVGGVVGGVVGLLLLLGLGAFLLWRRKRRPDFDGDFGPDRNIERPTVPDLNFDVANEDPISDAAPIGVNTQVHPYPLTSQYSDGSNNASGPGQMSEYGGHSALFAGSHMDPGSTSGHGRNMSDYDGRSVTTAGMAGLGAAGAGAGGGVAYLARQTSDSDQTDQHSQSEGPISARLAKQREAMASRGRMGVSNPDAVDDGEGGPSGEVMQHQDGGRVTGTEVPPSYNSIPGDR